MIRATSWQLRRPWIGLRALLGVALAMALGAGCRGALAPGTAAGEAYRTRTLRLVDPATQRPIPVRTYAPASGQLAGRKVALLNHGYGVRNSAYTYLVPNLLAHGYFVVSLQQVLPGDAPLPTTGNPAAVRRPAWERGVQSMRAVLRTLPRLYPGLDTTHTLLVGHSYGGDMVVLFAQQYPQLVQQVISLDNCRMPIPRQSRPRLLSLRSSDQAADPGVLPTPAEQAAYGIHIVPLPATRHQELSDKASAAQRREINGYISAFLAE